MQTPKPATERPQRADARRNRERILEAARGECAKHGANVQMDDIARGAGVGVGTVYRHFPTKETLIDALVAEKYRVAVENAEAALEIDDPWEAFATLLRRNAEHMARAAVLRDAFARLSEETPPATAVAGQAELEAVAGRVLARAQAAGVVRPDVSVDDIAILMSGLGASMARPGDVWRRHLELLLDGLRPPR
jgi:AcrR family transcriptional regulator